MSDPREFQPALYRRIGEVLEAEIGDELVAFDVETGDCFGFNEVARSVWRSLAEPKAFQQLRDELIADYDVGVEQCTRELHELLDDLIAKRMIEKTG